MKRLMKRRLMAYRVGSVVEISRNEAVIARSGGSPARRVLSDHEWSIWEQHERPVRFLAALLRSRKRRRKRAGNRDP